MLLDPKDPQHRVVLEAARSWGVPPSQFIGYGSTTTEHHYNGAGQLVRSVTSSPWTQDDRDNVFALLNYEADCCPSCRQPLAETTDPDNEGRFVPLLPIRCHRCTAVDMAQDAAQSHNSPGALLIPVEFRPAPPTGEDGPS